MVEQVDSLLIINKEIRAHSIFLGRTLFLISQIFYINLCDVRHILDLTFPYDHGIIDVMTKNLCDVGHTDMSDLPHCLFDSGITKAPKINHELFGDYEGRKINHEVSGYYEGRKINHELLGELK